MFRIELTDAADRDMQDLSRYLLKKYREFGASRPEAISRARARERGLRLAIGGLARNPYRGTVYSTGDIAIRFLNFNRAIVWIEVDEPQETVRILAVFFEGQDHLARMRDRLAGGAAG